MWRTATENRECSDKEASHEFADGAEHQITKARFITVKASVSLSRSNEGSSGDLLAEGLCDGCFFSCFFLLITALTAALDAAAPATTAAASSTGTF